MENEFSTLDIVKALKIPRERLRDWMNRSFIEPSVPADGQGTKAIFTREDVYGVALFQILIDHGLSREKSSGFVKLFIKDFKRKVIETPPEGGVAYKEAAYLLFRLPKDTKKPTQIKILGTFLGYDVAWKIDVDSGYPETKESRAFLAQKAARTGIPQPEKDKNWSFLHVVNIKAIREKVDAALNTL
jgi:hypothetical protein